MTSDILNTIIPIVAGFVSGAAGYIGGRRQRQKEVESSGLNNLEKTVSIYKTLIDDIQSRFNKEMDQLREKIIALETEIKEKEDVIETLEQRIRKYEGI